MGWRILVGDDQVQGELRDRFGDPIEGRLDGKHRTRVAVGLGHQPSPKVGEAVEIGRRKPLGYAEGGQFAVAVAGHGVGDETKAFEHSGRAKAEPPAPKKAKPEGKKAKPSKTVEPKKPEPDRPSAPNAWILPTGDGAAAGLSWTF